MGNIEKALNKLDKVNNWISNCDAKSSFVLTLLGVIVTVIFTSDIGAEMFEVFNCKQASHIDCSSIKYLIRLISVIAFFIALIFTVYHIYNTLKGRTDPQDYIQEGLSSRSNILFSSISSKLFKDFEKESNNETEEDYLNDINSQIFINSKIANKKFQHYNKSLVFIMVTLGCFVLFVILK